MEKSMLDAMGAREWVVLAGAVVVSLWTCAPARAQASYSAAILYPLSAGSRPESSIASQTVGYFPSAIDGMPNAAVWSGPVGSVTDVNPTGFTMSYMMATDGPQQIGNGYTGSNYNALLWSGTAASAVNLNPAGYIESYGQAISGTMEGGAGYGPQGGDRSPLVGECSISDRHEPAGLYWVSHIRHGCNAGSWIG